MSKQSSLFTFMSRNEKDTTKTMNSTDVSAPVKTSKFKFTKPTSRLQLQTNADENRTLNTIGNNKTNELNTVKKLDDCVVISDEEHSPLKSVAVKKVNDDIFEDFKSNDFTFTTASTLAKNDVDDRTMEALYAKYGTPKVKEKSTIDIDEALNSNASYVSAMKKLDENMERLKTSPKKTTTSKFKFNSRSKPTNVANQNATPISVSSNTSSFSTNSVEFSSTVSNKTSTVTSGAYSSAISNPFTSSISNANTNSASNSNATSINKFSPVNTSRGGITQTDTSTSQSSLSSASSYRPEITSATSPTDSSFKSVNSP